VAEIWADSNMVTTQTKNGKNVSKYITHGFWEINRHYYHTSLVPECRVHSFHEASRIFIFFFGSIIDVDETLIMYVFPRLPPHIMFTPCALAFLTNALAMVPLPWLVASNLAPP
jgi:hypothetical protein